MARLSAYPPFPAQKNAAKERLERLRPRWQRNHSPLGANSHAPQAADTLNASEDAGAPDVVVWL